MYPDSHDLKLSNRPVRTRMPGGVAGAPPMMEAPYADSRLQVHMRCGARRTPPQSGCAMRLVEFDADDVQLAVVHTALGADFVGEMAHCLRSATQDHGLQAVVMVEVRMHGRDRQVMVRMVQGSQALGQVALVVVEHIRQAGNAVFAGRAFELRLAEFGTQQVTHRFGPVRIAAPRHPGIELLGQAVIEGNGEAFHGRL